jgi:hypothetical protein
MYLYQYQIFRTKTILICFSTKNQLLESAIIIVMTIDGTLHYVAAAAAAP